VQSDGSVSVNTANNGGDASDDPLGFAAIAGSEISIANMMINIFISDSLLAERYRRRNHRTSMRYGGVDGGNWPMGFMG
jgi:hypothetical protein